MTIVVKIETRRFGAIQYFEARPDDCIEDLIPQIKGLPDDLTDVIFNDFQNKSLTRELPFNKYDEFCSQGKKQITIKVVGEINKKSSTNSSETKHETRVSNDQPDCSYAKTERSLVFDAPDNIFDIRDDSMQSFSLDYNDSDDFNNATGISKPTTKPKQSSQFTNPVQTTTFPSLFSPTQSLDPPDFENLISQIVDLGIGRENAIKALRKCRYDPKYAINDIFASPGEYTTTKSPLSPVNTQQTTQSNPTFIDKSMLDSKYNSLDFVNKGKVDRLKNKGYQLPMILQVLEACDNDEDLAEQILRDS